MQLPWNRERYFAGASAAPLPTQPSTHLFTVDVEEYFQVSAFENVVSRASWRLRPTRVARQMELLLDLLAEHGSRATFFVLGWIAERYPALVRRIRESGHEIASHGYFHDRVPDTDERAFRAEVRDSKALLEDLIGDRVMGYRAPSFSLIPGREWAFDVLLDEGYRYDSSLFPIRRPGYGHPGSQTQPFWIDRAGGRLLEIPMTTLRVAGVRLPAGGGAYFRHFPYAYTRYALSRSAPGVFYIHPWELDPGQPRVPVSWLTTRRHYGGIEHTVERIERLLTDFHFTSVAELYALGQQVGSAVPGTKAVTS